MKINATRRADRGTRNGNGVVPQAGVVGCQQNLLSSGAVPIAARLQVSSSVVVLKATALCRDFERDLYCLVHARYLSAHAAKVPNVASQSAVLRLPSMSGTPLPARIS